MNKKNFIILVLGIVVASCTNGKKEDKISSKSNEEVHIYNNEEGLSLPQEKCYICHSVTAKSHEEIIAPPLVAVKRRYKMKYKTKNDFVTGITDWALNPTEENPLMRGAVMQFKVMPKQPFNKEEIIKIATYIYYNELQKPAWFESHFNEEHPNGMGNGQGKGQGRGKGMRNN